VVYFNRYRDHANLFRLFRLLLESSKNVNHGSVVWLLVTGYWPEARNEKPAARLKEVGSLFRKIIAISDG
jgi:hypothetical protein